jgi:hypothetical protein
MLFFIRFTDIVPAISAIQFNKAIALALSIPADRRLSVLRNSFNLELHRSTEVLLLYNNVNSDECRGGYEKSLGFFT